MQTARKKAALKKSQTEAKTASVKEAIKPKNAKAVGVKNTTKRQRKAKLVTIDF